MGKTGTINLAQVRSLDGSIESKGRITFELFSSNVSDDTTYNVQISVSGDRFQNAQEGGTDITGTLTQNSAVVKSFEGNPGDVVRILFAGVTTGNVSYALNY